MQGESVTRAVQDRKQDCIEKIYKIVIFFIGVGGRGW